MLQDIYPHIYHNEFALLDPCDDDSVLCYKNGRLLMAAGGNAYLRYGDIKYATDAAPTYLFAIDNRRYFLIEEPPEDEDLYFIREVRELFSFPDAALAYAGIAGLTLDRWYRGNRFCARCGHPTERSAKERAFVCPCCGNVVYPRISPAVIVAVTDGDRLLCTRYAAADYRRYALIAGFTEIGETIEQTVAREVKEEVGVNVKNLRYYKSQPWALSDSLLMGFFCDLDGDDHITLDLSELSCGEWFARADVPMERENGSLTSEMMLAFKQGRSL